MKDATKQLPARGTSASADLDSQAVTGADVLRLQRMLGMSNEAFCELLRIPAARLVEITKGEALVTPLKNITLALMVRMLYRFPDLANTFRPPEVADFYEKIGGPQVCRERMLAVLFGKEAGASYRWLGLNGREVEAPEPVVRQLMSFALWMGEGFGALVEAAKTEAVYRGVNPFGAGSWRRPMSNATDVLLADLGPDGVRRGRPVERNKIRRPTTVRPVSGSGAGAVQKLRTVRKGKTPKAVS